VSDSNPSASETKSLRMKNGESVIGPPLLEGARIALTPVSRVFAQDIFREFTPEVTAWMFPKSPSQLDETHEFIDKAIRQWHLGTDLTFAILDKSCREFLGTCGLHGGGHPRRPEFGIWLKVGAHGKAFGREAISTLRDWSAEALDVDSFIYPVDRRNTPSRKIAESLGGIAIGERQVRSMSGVDLELVVYRISTNR
jgi:ribosomal-protein-alanine N-acetyltransferase